MKNRDGDKEAEEKCLNKKENSSDKFIFPPFRDSFTDSIHFFFGFAAGRFLTHQTLYVYSLSFSFLHATQLPNT